MYGFMVLPSGTRALYPTLYWQVTMIAMFLPPDVYNNPWRCHTHTKVSGNPPTKSSCEWGSTTIPRIGSMWIVPKSVSNLKKLSHGYLPCEVMNLHNVPLMQFFFHGYMFFCSKSSFKQNMMQLCHPFTQLRDTRVIFILVKWRITTIALLSFTCHLP